MKPLMILATLVSSSAAFAAPNNVVTSRVLSCTSAVQNSELYSLQISVEVDLRDLSTSYAADAYKVNVDSHQVTDSVAYGEIYGDPFNFETGGNLNGEEFSLTTTRRDDGKFSGRVNMVDFTPPEGVELTCSRVAPKLPTLDVTPYAKDNIKGLNTLLSSIVVAQEGLPLNSDNAAPDELYFIVYSDNQINPCKPEGKDRLACEIDYLQGRWNGTLQATFAVEDGKATKLLKAKFDGNY